MNRRSCFPAPAPMRSAQLGGLDGPRQGRLLAPANRSHNMMSMAYRGHRPVRRSCASHGFSFIELLVTCVLAGIIFAAMAPVFVSAQQGSAGDRARNIATNIAQDRIEKIRELAFDQIVNDATHLQSSTFCDGQFGITCTPAGSAKVYTITYSVENVPSTGAINYKRVGVTVAWTAPPSPVRPVTVYTIVMNPNATSASSSPSPSASPSPSPSPSPTTATTYTLTVLVSANYVNPSLGVTVVRTDVTPNVTEAPSYQVPTTGTPVIWNGLPAGTYFVTCNYYKNGNSNNKKTLTQTITITNANQTYTFTF